MADEVRHGPADAFAVAGMHAAEVFAVKIVQSGGLTGAASVASIALAANIDLYGGPMLEGAVGTIASAQLFSTFSELKWGTELFGPLLLTEEILIEPLGYENFALHLPQGAGLGITLDWDCTGRLQRDSKRGASVSMSGTAIPHTAFPTDIDPTETQHHEQANDRRHVAEDQRQRHERG